MSSVVLSSTPQPRAPILCSKGSKLSSITVNRFRIMGLNRNTQFEMLLPFSLARLLGREILSAISDSALILSFLIPKGLEISLHMSTYAGMDEELPSTCTAGFNTGNGTFMWEFELNDEYEKIAIRDGPTLQESFREKIYDKDKATGFLSSNLTINEKFNHRVNITVSDGNLILRNVTVQDSGIYKCSYRGITGPVKQSLVHLSVKPFKGKMNLRFVTPVCQVGEGRAILINQSGITINTSISQSINYSDPWLADFAT